MISPNFYPLPSIQFRVFLTSGWLKTFNCQTSVIRPLLNTDVNDALKLDDQLAEDLSPMNGPNFKVIYGNSRRSAKYCIIHAENDSPAFHEQSRRFYEMLKATGVKAELINVENTDHFGKFWASVKSRNKIPFSDIIERAIEPNFVLNQVISNELSSPE